MGTTATALSTLLTTLGTVATAVLGQATAVIGWVTTSGNELALIPVGVLLLYTGISVFKKIVC